MIRAPTLASDKFSVRVGLGSERRREHPWVDVGCIVVLCIAVLVQGVVQALGLPARIELAGDLAVAALAVWIAVVALTSGAVITVPYLVIALAAILVIAGLRSDDLVRLAVSVRDFLLLPVFALALAALGPSERRIRMVMIAIVGLVGVEFVITIAQAFTVSDVDFVVGTFGRNAGFNTTVVVLAGSCLALGIYAARAGGIWWLALAAVLPLYSIWGAVRAVLPVLPIVGLSVAASAWWVSAASADRRERWRRPLLALVACVLLPTLIIVGGYALTRPSDLRLFTSSHELGQYLAGTGVLTAQDDRVGRPVNAVPRAPETSRSEAFSVQATKGVSYAGVLLDQTHPLRSGRTYSFRAAVRPSVAGRYQLFVGVYGKTSGLSDSTKLPADRWTEMRVDDVRATGNGLPFLALSKSAGTYAGTESITFDCTAVAQRKQRVDAGASQPGCVYQLHTAGATNTAAPAAGGKAEGARRGGGGARVRAVQTNAPAASPAVAVPGHLSQVRTAIRLVSHDPLDFLVGMGLGATTYAQNLGVAPPPHDEYIAGNNDFGTLLVELGWVGVALVVASGALLAVGALLSARRAATGSWTRALLIAYPGVLVAMVAAAFFGTPFRNVGSATTLWALTGLVLAVLFQRSRWDVRAVSGSGSSKASDGDLGPIAAGPRAAHSDAAGG